jgi:hypothetical protein
MIRPMCRYCARPVVHGEKVDALTCRMTGAVEARGGAAGATEEIDCYQDLAPFIGTGGPCLCDGGSTGPVLVSAPGPMATPP